MTSTTAASTKPFKEAYKRISGRDWTQGREEGVLEEPNVAKAYAEVSGQSRGSPTNILTKYRNEYSVSIEDFADEVKAWLDKRPEGFRLNFFVDEVGQFIGSNTHLMLNLQTIAESLNTKCQGRAWVFVTSQEDMDKVVGDRTKQQGNDFSKIQARFKTRVKLTSADVEEVIRKRLLEKNEAGAAALSAIYAKESANFKTLFDFVDGAKTYRNYTDEAHFVGTYPSSVTSSRYSKRRSKASPTTTSSRVATARSASGRCSVWSSRSPRTSVTWRSGVWRLSTTCLPASGHR